MHDSESSTHPTDDATGIRTPSASSTRARDALRAQIARLAQALEPKTVAWRRDLHAHPELGNQEHRTAAVIAQHLLALGLEVRTGIARTGLVAVLPGAAAGPTVALRADMDALPVKERAQHEFASKQRGMYRGQEVDVMHACGHDGHVAVLMSVAEILSTLQTQLPGTVVFYFQPAEEGPSDFEPDGTQTWGARLMIEEGAMSSPTPDAVFGLHLVAGMQAGCIAYRPGAMLASSDQLRVRIRGRQTHAGRPWAGVDPIVVAAQVLMGMQTVVSRQTDISCHPAVISIGTIHGGMRANIIADSVDMEGTVRTYDESIRQTTRDKLIRTIQGIAAASGAEADIVVLGNYDTTFNDPTLTQRSLPSLAWAAHDRVILAPPSSGAEDFSFMARVVPGLYFFVGATPPSMDMLEAAANHSPYFEIDESALLVGVRALAALATDYLIEQAHTD